MDAGLLQDDIMVKSEPVDVADYYGGHVQTGPVFNIQTGQDSRLINTRTDIVLTTW